MSKEKETEKIINDKLNSREFTFDEKAWAGMETLLDAQQKKRRFGFFWYFSASMFVALVAGAAWFFMPATYENEDKTELATVANQTAIVDNELAMTANQSATAASELASAHNQSATTANPTAMTNHQLATTPNQLASVANQSVTTASELAMIDNQLAMAANELATIKNQAATNPTKVATAETQVATIPTEVATTKTQVATIPTQVAMTEIEVATVPTEVKTVENEQDSTKTVEQPPLTDSTSLAETAKNSLTAPGKETKNAWGVLAGVGYWYQYQQTPGATNHKGGFPFTGGIYYQRTFSKRFDLGLSVLYSSRGALNFDKTITNTNYGFGVESDETTISPQTLHYLNVPLHIRFNISQRSHIIIGAAYYQLLATTFKVTHTIESSFASTLTSSEKQTGEHKGFRKNDVAAFIGYELTLFDRMNAGLQFSYGFYDNTVNGYNGGFNGADSFDRNISLQLQLKYDLIRH
jgi:hypothetical protein